MLKSLIVSFFFIIGCATLGGVLYYHTDAQKTVDTYFKRYHITPASLSFQTAEKAFFGNGLILYQAQFPKMLFPHKIEKIHLSANSSGHLTLALNNFSFDITDTIRILHKEKIEHIMRKYTPYKDALRYPLESMLLAGIKHMKTDLQLTFVPAGDKMKITGQLVSKNANIDFKMFIDTVPSSEAFGFTKGKITEVQIRVKNPAFLETYAAYARRIGVEPPTQIKQILEGSQETFFLKPDISFNAVLSPDSL